MSRSNPTARRTILAGLTCGLTALALDVVFDGRISTLDRWLLTRPDADPLLWRRISTIGERPTLVVMTSAAVAVSAGRRGWWRPALSVGLGVASRARLARHVNRPRPPESWWRTCPDGPSFPSRHVTWVGLGTLALASQAPGRWRPLSYTAAGSVTAAVAVSRLRLGVHWPSDVVAGAMYALALHVLAETGGRVDVGDTESTKRNGSSSS